MTPQPQSQKERSSRPQTVANGGARGSKPFSLRFMGSYFTEFTFVSFGTISEALAWNGGGAIRAAQVPFLQAGQQQGEMLGETRRWFVESCGRVGGACGSLGRSVGTC
jgi:hypothetical protein